MNSLETLILLLVSNTASFLLAYYLGLNEGKRSSRKQYIYVEEELKKK